MDLSRRGFIGILGAAASAPRLFAKAPSDYDPDLTVLLSVTFDAQPTRKAYYLTGAVTGLHRAGDVRKRQKAGHFQV